ncbi:hypothetical protein ABEF95_002854 [Exophiala dermatitidis]
MATPLGDLEQLPGELRNTIYEALILQRGPQLAYTSKQIYNEIIPYLEEKFVLGFHIDPAVSSSVVHIINQSGRPWGTGNQNTFDARSPHINQSLEMLPIDKFKQVRFIIDAPNPKDPGQLVRVWYQVTRLLDAILPRWRDPNQLPQDQRAIVVPKGRQDSKLPAIEITFRETGERTWGGHDMLNHSVPSYENWVENIHSAQISPDSRYSDVAVILTPFLRLRNAASLQVHLPAAASSDLHIRFIMKLLEERAGSDIPFGMDLDEQEDIADAWCLAMQNTLHVWLDCLLDDLRGPTANLLRRDRFQYFCPEYEYKLGTCLQGFEDFRGRHGIGGLGSISEDLWQHVVGQYFSRLAAAYKHRQMAHARYGKWNNFAKRNESQPEESFASGLWEKWYPRGIAAKSLNIGWKDYETLPWFWRAFPVADRRQATACTILGEFNAGCSDCVGDSSREHRMSSVLQWRLWAYINGTLIAAEEED